MEFQVKKLIILLSLSLLLILNSCITTKEPVTEEIVDPPQEIFPIYHGSQETEMIFQDQEHRRIDLLYTKLLNYLDIQPQIIPEIMKRHSVASIYLLYGAIYNNDRQNFVKAVNILIDNGVYHTDSSKIIRYLVIKHNEDWKSLVHEVRGMY